VANQKNDTNPIARILIVDDEASVCATFKRILEQDGLLVDTTTEVSKAIGLVRTTPYAVIAVDYRIPGSSGFSVLSECSPIQPNATYLMFSGEFDKHLDVPSSQGKFQFIPKNTHPERFVELIRLGIVDYRDRVATRQDEWTGE